jgi:REP element-mobilizing transposase RayT
MKTKRSHSSSLRKGRSSEGSYFYAVTKCTKERRSILTKQFSDRCNPADVIKESIEYLEDQRKWKCIGYVIMPDHLHLVIQLRGEMSLSDLMASFSKYTARKINQLLGNKGSLWQEGFFDHALRGEKTCKAYLEYMRQNPCRAGLADDPEDWPYLEINTDWC